MQMIIFRQEDVSINIDAHGNKIPLVTGNILISGKIFKGATGGWGNGPLPAGLYKVEKAIKLADTPENALYKGDKFPWYARITPLFNTSRNGLLFHPKGKYVGTLGCIETWERDEELFNLLTKIDIDCKLKVI